jgi:diguanylate cyclase (GGDEF)-like protein/PAS domain S-box-containing protein
MWLHLGTALALLLAILTVVTVVAKSISRPLRHLSRVAEDVRRTGNQELRAVGHGSDETARLIGAFNDMLDQLGRERESQKELAASARAADAQRELVHATPIALVVTSIPGHEVLHANPPAQRWLGGRSTDPWKTGMEPSVRSRFFQQLADREHVDEFEVRWRIGDEAAWAVLSARRVQYQGQDAVLTAFSPINHLKLMERRLELWAKVFEASGEGILIVDADRRILTVNRAFTRHTGYDMQDVVGEKPSMVLPDIETPGDANAMWATVAQRGMWHGELALRRRNGSEFPAWVMVSAVRQSLTTTGHRGPPALDATTVAEARGTEISHYIFTSIDISDRKKSEQRIQFLAEHDVLTELPNRSLCTERLRRAVGQAQRDGHQVAVLFIDLDRFKDINDTLGHHIGDSLLRSVARRLQESVRGGDTVSRLGGDEFVIVLGNVADVDEVTHIVEQRVIPRIRAPHLVNGAELHVSCSVGIAMYPGDADDIDNLMRNADTAMYQAKGTGKDRAQFYTAAMTERAQARMQLEADLRRALELEQLSLHWQPRVRAKDGRLVGVEGLLRWQHPDRGMVVPDDFIGVAEETGLIVPIGGWVIDEACRQIACWRAEGVAAMGVSINLSARQLRSDGLIDVVRDALQRNKVPPGMLELELTESMVMDDAEDNLRQMHALRALGVGLSIDDFGTGYSSLAYLNRFPIDKLKIDRSFVHTMLTDRTDRAITLAIIGLGHTLGLKVVAEGVERIGEADLLREAHCDEVQGFYYARPMPAGEIAAWSARHQPEAATA